MASHDPNPHDDPAPQPGSAALEPPVAEAREAQIARLFREHNQALIRFLLTRVGSEQEARDVAQKAYVRMLQLDTHGAVSFLSAYLFKTASNIAIDRLRERSVRRRVDGELSGEPLLAAVAPDTILEAREQLVLVDRFIQELPPKCRRAFYLHRLHDMSPPDIAAELGVSPRMVHHYLVRALVHVQTRMEGTNQTQERAP